MHEHKAPVHVLTDCLDALQHFCQQVAIYCWQGRQSQGKPIQTGAADMGHQHSTSQGDMSSSSSWSFFGIGISHATQSSTASYVWCSPNTFALSCIPHASNTNMILQKEGSLPWPPCNGWAMSLNRAPEGMTAKTHLRHKPRSCACHSLKVPAPMIVRRMTAASLFCTSACKQLCSRGPVSTCGMPPQPPPAATSS
jgi:hypothetical protein